MGNFLTILWAFLNSAIGITIVGSLVAFVLAKLWTAKPAWKKYGGYLVNAVKYAEKTIPDGTANANLARLDTALRWFLKVYEDAEGRPLPASQISAVKQALTLTHAEIEPTLISKASSLSVLCVLCGLTAALTACSPTQGEWNRRAQEGMRINAGNLTMMHEMLAADVESDRAAFVAAMFSDIKRARGGQLPDVTFDDAYIDQAGQLLAAGLVQYDAKRKKVDDDYLTAMRNSGYVVEALSNIQKLNNAWSGNGELIASQVSELRDMILQMQQARGTQKRRRRRNDDGQGGPSLTPLEDLAVAVGSTIEKLRLSFPSATDRLVHDFGTTYATAIAKTLAEADPGLLERTQQETSFAGVCKIVLPLVVQTLTKFL